MAIEMVKPITLTDTESGKKYVLEFSRATVKVAEQNGFDKELIDSQPTLQITRLFYASFLKNHPNMTFAKAEKVIDELKGLPKKMIERLVQLYNYASDTLIRDEDEDEEALKNAKLTVEM